jgi:hypothetical protein
LSARGRAAAAIAPAAPAGRGGAPFAVRSPPAPNDYVNLTRRGIGIFPEKSCVELENRAGKAFDGGTLVGCNDTGKGGA